MCLTIKGRIKKKREKKSKNYHLMEKLLFQARFKLPCAVCDTSCKTILAIGDQDAIGAKVVAHAHLCMKV